VLFFYAVILTTTYKLQTTRLLQFLFWSAVIISAFGLFQSVSFIHLPLRFWGNGAEVKRIVSFFEYPNALALYLAPLIGLFSTLWLKQYPIFKNRLVLGLGILVMTWALILTYSRGAWLALATGLFVLCVRQFGLKKIVYAALLVVLFLFFVPSVQQRLGLGLSDTSSLAHIELWNIGLDKILINPIFGMGLGGFATLNLGVNYPHNIFLNFWLELGLLGALSFAWIINLVLEKLQKNRQPLWVAAAIYLLILIIHGLVDVPYFKNDLAILFWFVIALFYL